MLGLKKDHICCLICIQRFRASPAVSLNFYTVWWVNSDFYLLSSYFIKYNFQQILYIFSIPLKYYFFIISLIFIYLFFFFILPLFIPNYYIFKFLRPNRFIFNIYKFFSDHSFHLSNLCNLEWIYSLIFS